MKLTKVMASVAGGVALALALAACSGTASEPAPVDGSAPLQIGLIMLQGDTYFEGIQSGLEAAVKADGGTVTTGLSNGDPAQENQVAQGMIQKQVDAILMQPAADEASLATMKAIKDAGITLICYGNCIGVTADEANVDGVVQSDNTALGTGTGEIAAAYVKENIGDSVKLAILNCDIASACKLRKSGFLDALKAAGIAVDIVSDQEAYLADKATPVAKNILAANPSVDIFWASNEGGTVGGVIGTKGSNKPVFGTDITTQIAEFILESGGALQATTGQDPVGTAQGAYEMAKQILAGETPAQFSVELPGITYDRGNPATANEFLGK